MISQDQLRSLVGATAHDRDGDRIGKIGHVYFDDQTDQPKWITVNTGLFGLSESFVPLQGADVRDDRVTVAYDKATVKDAPNVSAEGHLSPAEEQELYRYYSLDYGDAGTADTRTAAAGGQYGRSEYAETDRSTHDRAGYADADRTGTRDVDAGQRDRSGVGGDAMTRSEERLNVGTETRETGRARLRKHVVTEHQQVEVPVSREEVRVEREPITDSNREAAYSGPAITEDEHEVTLREERPVVDKEAVPVERVRLGTETVRDTETVGDEVRREEIEVDDEVGGRHRDRDRDRR